MKISAIFLILILISNQAFPQAWGTTVPQITGGYDIEYVESLNTTYTSSGTNVVTISHDSVTSSISGPQVNKFRYFFNTLYAATNGTNSFRYFDGSWKLVANATLNARSFYLDTMGSDILILTESSTPAPGHVIKYDGSGVSAIPDLVVNSTAVFSVTFMGNKFISYVSPYYETHLLMWDGVTQLDTHIPDNYDISNLFVSNSKLYATIYLLGIYQLWVYDGMEWKYVLEFPEGFNCQGAYNDHDQSVYFFGSKIFKYSLPDNTLIEIENPITSTIYAMTKDLKTGIFYFSSNYIFWWDGVLSVPTGVLTPHEASDLWRYDMSTGMLYVDYTGQWSVFNSNGQEVLIGKGIVRENLNELPSGIYMISATEVRWAKNKFFISK